MSKLQLLDVTIREGSTAVGYRFTSGQVAEIVKALDEANIHYIEIGNGGGLGFFDHSAQRTQSTDIEQLRAAKKVVKQAKLGFLAGAAPLTEHFHIDAISKEADFIRIATRIGEIDKAKDNIQYSLSKNLEVFVQLMQVTRASLKEIVTEAKKAESLGAQAIYLVDTIGALLPEQVTTMVSTLKKELNIPVGFHAHNNLMLGVANSLVAAKAGADFIDGSLLGLSRDAGNAQLEAIVAVLQQEGFAKDINLDRLLKASSDLIEPIAPYLQGISAAQIRKALDNVV